MLRLLRAGILAQGNGFYVHPGDLQWWLFYPPLGIDLTAFTWLWDDPAGTGEILGWMLVDPTFPSFELFAHPAVFGSDLHRRMLLWAEAEARRLCPPEADGLNKLWIAGEDAFQRAYLESRGYTEKHADTFFLRLLDETMAAPGIPGWEVRLCRGVDEAAERARAQYGAFNSAKPFEAYTRRFERFMRSEAYARALDLVAVDESGRIGAFCIAWLDDATRRGHLEPVGTHPDCQRRGLGRAVLMEALRRLGERGMRAVSVLTPEDNAPAQALYRSLGFQPARRLSWYQKSLAAIPEGG